MEYDKNEDYCTLSPEELFGVKFNYSCYLHDRQYRNEVANRKTRLKADQDFRDSIYNKFVVADKKFYGWIVSRIYYYAVRLFSERFWTVN